MTRSPDILFMAEYIKNVLYFATVRQGKALKNTVDTHYFCIDNELVYENYYSDFGPLNLGCVYKYCKILNEKLKHYLNDQIIVHYTSIEPKKKANSAFLLGCYGVLYLNLTPRDALKPLMVHGQNYRPFQDATPGESAYTISLMDCLQAIKKARELGFFNFQDFNYEEYDRLDKIQGGDLNWIVPGKFLAFNGPVDYSVSLYHPPEMYIDYFVENNVKIVIRLNKRLYDGNVFNNVGIIHYDLFFPDGSCPPRHILFKFLQISEEADCALAVHCKAGLGRTGSLIGCYLIKHYRMTSHEAISWMRICRPGSVIGHQQGWLEQLEPWLIKQGNLYRKRTHQNTEQIPQHEYGVYSITEKTSKQRPVVFHKSPSPPPPVQKQVRTDIPVPTRPQNSKIKEDYRGKPDHEDDEVFITSCDLTVVPTTRVTQMKGCVIRNNFYSEDDDSDQHPVRVAIWKKYLCCQCFEKMNDGFWKLAVRCASCFPDQCNGNGLCSLIDWAAHNKTAEKECDWRLKTQSMINSHQKICRGSCRHERRRSIYVVDRKYSVCRNCKKNCWPHPAQEPAENIVTDIVGKRRLRATHRDHYDSTSNVTRRTSGAGDPKAGRPTSRSSTTRSPTTRESVHKSNVKESEIKPLREYNPITTYRTSQALVIKNVNDARNYLMRSSIYNTERDKQLNMAVVTPHFMNRPQHQTYTSPVGGAYVTSSYYGTASKIPAQPQTRKRLGRSPSPPARMSNEQSRATNTPQVNQTQPNYKQPTTEKFLVKDSSKCALKDVLSRLKLSMCRDGSLGAASLGATREAPAPRRAPSVRSDERPLATQGDMLNSIKFQRRLRETYTDKSNTFHEKVSLMPKKPSIKNVNSRTNNETKPSQLEFGGTRDRQGSTSRSICNHARPMSPKARRNVQTTSFY